VTTAPPAGAGPLNSTMPSAVPCLAIGFGPIVNATSTGATTWRRALAWTPPAVARICAAWLSATGDVVIGKVALAAPAGTVTLVATVADGSSLSSVTTTPPAGAGARSVTDPEAGLPPCTVAGARLSVSR